MATKKQILPALGLALTCALTLAPALTLAQPAPQRSQSDPSAVIVPMDDWGGRPVVAVKLNGKGPFRLLLDTGTSFELVLDHKLAQQVGVDTGRSDSQRTPAEGDELSELARMTIGSAEFTKVQVMTTNFGGFGPADDSAPLGILGLPLFSKHLLTLDYPQRQIVLARGELPPPGGEVLPFAPAPAHDPIVSLTASVAGVPVRVHIDTGSPSFITLLNKMQQQLPLEGEPRVVGMAQTPAGAVELRTAKLKGVLKIGSIEFKNPRMDFADLEPMVLGNCGNIGYQLLKDFALTIDQKNRRVQLRRG